MATKLEALQEFQRGKWMNDNIPEIMTVAEAYAAQGPSRRFCTVAWWGDEERWLPAGLTRFDFEHQLGNEFVIMWRDEPQDRVGTLPADELVLMFSD